MPRVRLDGCRPEPLGAYLKALAVLRLVSRQKDPEARGWWWDERFWLESELDEDRLVRFFLDEYRPTPVVAPWNGGSGFYVKDRKVGIDGLAGSTGERFSDYRAAIAICRSVSEVGEEEKPKDDRTRLRIQQACRNRLPDSAVDWLDAAVAVTTEGGRAFPPILGTGGNEGRLDYTNNFMENLVKLVVKPDPRLPVEALLRNALFDTAVVGLRKGPVGQYDPGRAGGFNQGQEVETKDVPTNPWNFVLTMEGAVTWASGLHRRQGTAYSRAFLSSPFTVRPSAVGFNSAAAKDEALARAEIWAPIWDRGATFGEVELLLREGRAELRRRPAETGLEFARAASSLGVDRRIRGFVRFALLKRRGDSYVALPAGRIRVRDVPGANLLEECEPLLERVDRFIRGFRDNPPAELATARRRYDDAVYEYLLRGEPARFYRVAAALGRLHRRLLLRPEDSRVVLGPRLSGDWLRACANRPEARLAAALSRIRAEKAADGTYVEIRDNLMRGRSFSWEGSDLTERMVRTLARRLLEAERSPEGFNPVWSDVQAGWADVSAFLEGSVDEGLVEDLLFAFTLVRGRWQPPMEPEERPLPASYCLLRLLFDPTPAGERVKGEPRVLPLLRAGRVGQACGLAQRRLAVSGFPVVRVHYADEADGRRLGAALLIPVPRIERRAEWAGVVRKKETAEEERKESGNGTDGET